MIRQILLAVDDSPPGIAAARIAVDLAGALGARVRAINVIADGYLTERLTSREYPAEPETAARRSSAAAAATSILRYVTRLADQRQVECEASEVDGEVAECILHAAQTAAADLIVLGRSDLHDAGSPYVGSHTRHVLEFADRPVLVVPRHGRLDGGGGRA